jgi:hypothetical protein
LRLTLVHYADRMIQCLSTPGFGLTEKISALTLKPGIILVELRKLDPSCRSMAFEKMAVTIERYRQKASLSLTRPQLAALLVGVNVESRF